MPTDKKPTVPRRRARRKKKSPNTIERRILFYRVYSGTNPAERLPFDVQQMIANVQTLAWDMDADASRYSESTDGNSTICWVQEPNLVALATSRRANLPQVESSGKLSNLPINDDAGLAEKTHIVFFPNNIVGCEFNFYAPRVQRLGAYLREKFGTVVNFELLLRNDVASRLQQFDEVSLLHLRVSASYSSVIRKLDEDLGSALDAAANASGAEDVELILRRRSRKNWLSKSILDLARGLVSRKDLFEQARTFKLKGSRQGGSRLEMLDLLSDAFVVQKEMSRAGGRARAVDGDSACEAIKQAYKEHEEALKEAASVTVAEAV